MAWRETYVDAVETIEGSGLLWLGVVGVPEPAGTRPAPTRSERVITRPGCGAGFYRDGFASGAGRDRDATLKRFAVNVLCPSAEPSLRLPSSFLRRCESVTVANLPDVLCPPSSVLRRRESVAIALFWRMSCIPFQRNKVSSAPLLVPKCATSTRFSAHSIGRVGVEQVPAGAGSGSVIYYLRVVMGAGSICKTGRQSGVGGYPARRSLVTLSNSILCERIILYVTQGRAKQVYSGNSDSQKLSTFQR
ncbi:hypothetical protein AHAS_Ahas02G0204800 [Arachis hypogaea]